MKVSTESNSFEHDRFEASRLIKLGSISLSRTWFAFAEWILIALLFGQVAYRVAPRVWEKLNSDFPNYYLTARLAREHYDTSRIYEWIWFQRQKDHQTIDQSTVGMAPITPFSTLVLYPLASLPALSAKHCWTILNLVMLAGTLWLLHLLTSLSWRRLLLIIALSIPLRMNFMLGQYYVLLLLLLILACALYVNHRRFLAGMVIGLSAGLKIFPAIYLLYFLRKRDWRAFLGGAVAMVGSLAVSIRVFGWQLNRTYISQVLPATFRGECLAPYDLQAASLSALLHRLFIFEPELNPHPAVNIPWLSAILHPVLSMVMVAPAILMIIPDEYSPRRIQVEWAAVLLASLVISTSPASYLFSLLIFPVAVIGREFLEEGKKGWFAFLLLLYLVVGLVRSGSGMEAGWGALIEVPRLYVLIVLAVFGYLVMLRQGAYSMSRTGRPLWMLALLIILLVNVVTNLRHQQGLYADFRWRIAQPLNILSATHPAVQNDKTLFVALLGDGYHWAAARGGNVTWSDKREGDYLAITATKREQWVENVGNESTVQSATVRRDAIKQAESPVLSFDGHWLAFLRENRGRAILWMRDLNRQDIFERPVTPREFNVLEMSFLPDDSLVFAADSSGHASLFISDQNGGRPKSLDVINARFPSVSPDGRWLVYSQLERGNWNLWLRDLRNEKTDRLTRAECNDTESVWTEDSKSLIYVSDCGRGLGLAGLCRRRIIP
ncbi:MAG TPA: glycosyltransferase 87 family protein [Edaphobacter sp.]|nr:glycosyltransferase 87 family protein [Edaphobacter sp.]